MFLPNTDVEGAPLENLLGEVKRGEDEERRAGGSEEGTGKRG